MFEALLAVGVPADVAHAFVAEQCGVRMDVSIGDVCVENLPHTRGRQGNCATPFVFSAVLCFVLAPVVREWRARSFGVPVRLQSGVHHLAFAIYADNCIMLGKPVEISTMVREATAALATVGLRWKPSSIAAWGRPGVSIDVQDMPTSLLIVLNAREELAQPDLIE